MTKKWIPFVLLILNTTTSCTNSCGHGIEALWSGGRCGDLGVQFRSKHVGIASCQGIPSTRQIDIQCTKSGSGSNGLCSSSAGADGSGYYVILMPDDGSGVFHDSTVGAIPDCATLWTIMNGDSLPSDLVGIYYSDTAAGDALNCPVSDTGCSHLSNNCVSTWDLATGGGTSQPAILTAGRSLLACAFLDTPLPGNTPAAGPPPTSGSGVLALAPANQMAKVSVGTNIVLSNWVDY